MKSGATLAAIALAVCAAPVALSQPGHALNCDEPLVQAEINMCARRDHEAADKEMTIVYEQVVAQYRQQDRDYADLGPEYVGSEMLLSASQESWLTSRSDFCAARGITNYGGSMRPAVIAGCLAMLTRSRTEELRWLLE